MAKNSLKIDRYSKSILPEDHPLRDFRNFLYLVWKDLLPNSPVTPVQYDITKHLMDTYYSEDAAREIIEAFRGVGKSWITGAFACWVLLNQPQTKILVVSASRNRADDFTTFCLSLIQRQPFLNHLAPNSEQRASKVSFDVGPAIPDHAPSVKSIGISGQLAGSRADIIIADDVEVVNNSMTQLMRDRLAAQVQEFDAILKPSGKIIYLGTPQTEMTLYNTLQERGYKLNVWPARYPKKSYPGLAPMISKVIENEPEKYWTPTDPLRFDEQDLLEREASYGRSGFSLQFMLDTTLSDREKYPLKLSDLIVMDINQELAHEKVVWSPEPKRVVNDIPTVGLKGDKYYYPMDRIGEMLPYNGSVMFVDPSGRGADETAVCVVKHLNSQLYLTELEAFDGGYTEDTLSRIAEIAKEQQVNLILVESNFGDGMFTSLLSPVINKTYPCTIEEVRHHIQKEQRIIDTLEPVMNSHRLIIDKRLIQKDYDTTQHRASEHSLKYQLFYQMTRITRDRGSLVHDDRLDCLAGAVRYWVDWMNQDIEKEIVRRQDSIIKKELSVFHKSIHNDKTISFNIKKKTHPKHKHRR